MRTYGTDNQYENFKQGIKQDVVDFAIDGILAPIALFVLIVLGATLPVMAFGKDGNWGLIPQLLIGIGEPIIILLMFISKQFRNNAFITWYLIFWGAISLSIFGSIAFVLLREYFSMF